jgi:hypothetical protein
VGPGTCLAELPETLGSVSVEVMRPALVQAFLDGYAGRPGKQMAALTALKQLERWAIVRDLLPNPITLASRSSAATAAMCPGRMLKWPWPRNVPAPIWRRRSRLGPTPGSAAPIWSRCAGPTLRTSGAAPASTWQMKTGRELWVPMTQALQTAMATWERRPGFILLRATGAPWTRADLSKAWERERQNNESLASLRAAGLVMHGLRATACVRLSRSGASTRQIADMVGMSEDMVGRYCRLSSQRENASAAIVHLEGTPREHVANKWQRKP